MLQINLPSYPAKVQQQGNKAQIFDDLRRRFVALTPEEWVRQHFVHFLINQRGYSAALMANEVSLSVADVQRRCDTVVYDREARPLLIVEYKAPHVRISQTVFNQVCAYNSVLRVPYIVVSNGLVHYCCRMDPATHAATFLPGIPTFAQLTASAP